MLDRCSTKPYTPKTYGLLFELMTGPETEGASHFRTCAQHVQALEFGPQHQRIGKSVALAPNPLAIAYLYAPPSFLPQLLAEMKTD